MAGFDVTNIDTWHLASDAPLKWNGKFLYAEDTGDIMTEKQVRGLFTSMFAFLERNDEIIPIDKKLHSIRTLLDRMSKYQSSPSNDETQKASNHFEETQGIINPNNVYGGYEFSLAQLEVLDGYTTVILENIGKIMATDKSDGKLKQEIFNTLGVDGEWVVKLRYHEPPFEERAMREYFSSCEFETA